MQVNVDFEKYAKNTLKKLESKLKKEKGEFERKELERDIAKHKEKYASYLK